MARPRFSLHVVTGPMAGRRFVLPEGDVVLGREPQCLVTLPDESVGLLHCALRVQAERVILAPGAGDETRVNGEPVGAARLLRVGDELGLGIYTLTLKAEALDAERRWYPGHQVGPYRLGPEIGAGAVGRVYEAHDDDGRVVALKVLRMRGDWSPRQQDHRCALFRREAEALAGIEHPNVVRSYGSGEHDGVPWLALELLEGLNLREKLQGGRLPVRQIERFMFQLCSAVAAVHEAGVIHRDLKPANVMLVGPDERVVLTDFGLAQPRGAPKLDELDPSLLSGVVRVGRQIGTPAYMAPEQTGGGEADLRSDVWALGAMLYELIGGRRPFPAPDVRRTLHAVVNACPDPLPDDVEPHLRGAVYRCLQKQPGRRFASAVELVEALVEKRLVQLLPVGKEAPAMQPLTACPRCRAPIDNAVRCKKCGLGLFRYTSGQVITVPQRGTVLLACGTCAGQVQVDSPRCRVCKTVYRDDAPEGVSRTATDLKTARPMLVDVYSHALALLTECPACKHARAPEDESCRKCGMSFRAYVHGRVGLELAVGGWALQCKHCSAVADSTKVRTCPRCGLNFVSGQFPDGTKFQDKVPPALRKRIEG